MALPVFYTPFAKESLTAVYDFISNKYGSNVADKFLLKTEKTIALIAQHSFMFKLSIIDKTIRVGLITKQISLFYRVDTTLQLLFFWDNRQEPIFIQ